MIRLLLYFCPRAAATNLVTMESISLAAESPFKYHGVAAVRKTSSPKWKGEAEDTDLELRFWGSNHEMSSANSLSYALENSLKLWQVTVSYHEGTLR